MTALTEEKIITDAELTAVTDGALEGTETSAPSDTEPAATPDAPAIRIVKGNPTDADVAALVTVLAAASAGAAPEGDGKPPETWGAPTRMHRQWAPFSPYSYPNRG
ncbi:acyl-CoA carboxylase subunit epsilon [Rhodococcus sp. HNM0563]|uniref:acyl-CoA carboxylase subunit epsilon n=1 Tax=unclassified Rhodococcus (in: high G+C Gram-positive bacteria) TaxID=192944 RepID=UPI00146AE062|nr:acyl-CoA carboxylase subunit epsilon [Rhodococcus sp. F64268]MCK0091140.1 acyl-CoA carboxylase subunit epsilon [Rhodococcus sp. F64268]NLU60819.1 acyl-CoA carboxylase subunit epsilon [Rhodococcus sp. HNM0563]